MKGRLDMKLRNMAAGLLNWDDPQGTSGPLRKDCHNRTAMVGEGAYKILGSSHPSIIL